MLLEALQDIPSSVSAIVKGQTFREPDPERAQDYIRSGYARVPEIKTGNGSDVLSWPGSLVVILASGPSLSLEQCDAVRAWRDADVLRKVIAINTTFRRATWADVVYACDGEWWECKENGRTYLDEVRTHFELSQLWTQDVDKAKKHGLRLIKSKRANGLSSEPGLIYQNESSGLQAIGLAHQAKSARVYLLGFDNHGDHWHGKHPSPLNKSNDYKRWAMAAKAMANQAAAAGLEIINCTPKSQLGSFPMKAWQEVFA